MRERKMSILVDQCLDQITSGRSTLEECLKKYPEIQESLKQAMITYDHFKSAPLEKLNLAKREEFKKRILMSLPDRGEVVTKKQTLRYRWQNTKRRFAMTWVIIVTTIISLVSGAGVVYASNDALPGEGLYPVKTWAENVQLWLAPDDVDVELNGIFASQETYVISIA